MELRTKYILNKELYNYFFNCDLEQTINRLNTVLRTYNSYNFNGTNNKLFIYTNNLIYCNFTDCKNKYTLININELKQLIVEVLNNFILEDLELIYNYCL